MCRWRQAQSRASPSTESRVETLSEIRSILVGKNGADFGDENGSVFDVEICSIKLGLEKQRVSRYAPGSGDTISGEERGAYWRSVKGRVTSAALSQREKEEGCQYAFCSSPSWRSP